MSCSAVENASAPVGERPLVVQSDGTVLLAADSPDYETARDLLLGFAQLERSPEQLHTYRITGLSLWNAAAVGLGFEAIAGGLTALCRYPVPQKVLAFIKEQLSRYGRARLVPGGDGRLLLTADVPALADALEADPRLEQLLSKRGAGGFVVEPKDRGALKQAMVHAGYPVEDLCGYAQGGALAISLRPESRSGATFGLRDYQLAAVEAFHQGGGPRGGAGVVVLPCGAGKTLTGIAVMARTKARTLVLTTSTLAVHQWGVGGFEGCELRDRPSGREPRHPGLGHLRVQAGRSAAAGPNLAAQGTGGALLLGRLARHDGAGLRSQAPALPATWPARRPAPAGHAPPHWSNRCSLPARSWRPA